MDKAEKINTSIVRVLILTNLLSQKFRQKIPS